MQEDGPIVQPIWRAVFAAYDKRVKGFSLHPSLYIFGEQLAIDEDPRGTVVPIEGESERSLKQLTYLDDSTAKTSRDGA